LSQPRPRAFPAAFDETRREKHTVDRTRACTANSINLKIRFFQKPIQNTPGKRAE